MTIESMHHYLLDTLPPILGEWFDGLHRIPPPILWTVIVLLCISQALLISRLRKGRLRERTRYAYFRKVSLAPTLQEAVASLGDFLRQIEPDIVRLGVYIREGESFRLTGGSGEAGAGKGGMEQSIRPGEEYLRQGRFHLHTFHQEKGEVAVRIASYNRIDMEKIGAELYYLSTLLEGLARLARTRGELTAKSVVDESATIFNPALLDLREYFELVATIVFNAYRLDTLRILAPEGETLLGASEYREEAGKLLYLRATGLRFQLFRKSGLSNGELAQIGKFLDLISAMHAMYSSEQHLTNYLYFLEASIEVYERNAPFERRHSEEVRAVALAAGEALGLQGDRLTTLGYACRFHDIGMLGQLSGIASKSGSLTEREHARIKFHPVTGRNITKVLDSRYPVSAIIQQHHELLDGSGYPQGVSGASLSREARILAAAEVLVGIMSDRPHRPGKTLDQALSELETMVPGKIDPAVFQALTDRREALATRLKELS